MRKTVFIVVVSFTLICFAVSHRLANASYEKRKPPIPPPGTAKKEPKVKVLKRLSFYVTAYYGPQIRQERYAHGSYRKDVRINGAGKETRSGKVPRIGFAASDWGVLRRGTQFRILDCDVLLGTDSPKPVSEIIFTVEDTGGGVKGKHVDIFTGFGDPGRKTAVNFDCRKYVIEVVECSPIQ